jgi:hypothetical protein
MLDALLGPWRYLLYAGIVAAVIGGVAWGVHLYNESVRAPLQQTIDDLREKRVDDQKRAAALMAERENTNRKELEIFKDKARTSDDLYKAEIARIRAAANVAGGLRFSDPFASRCAPGQAGKSDTGSFETATTGRELSPELTAFLRAEANRADEIAAYAQSCYRHVNKIEAPSRPDAD